MKPFYKQLSDPIKKIKLHVADFESREETDNKLINNTCK